MKYFILLLLCVVVSSNWCEVNNTIVCKINTNEPCLKNGWNEVDNIFLYKKSFMPDSIRIECDAQQNITINVVLFQTYSINIPNSIISFNGGNDLNIQTYFNEQNKTTSFIFKDLTKPVITSTSSKLSLKSCIENCEDCDSIDPEICITCQSGFFLNENQTCSNCEELNCVASSDTCDQQTGNCSKCLEGYTPIEGMCFPCSDIDEWCLECSQTSFECTVCYPPLLLSENKNSCDSCDDGMFNFDNTTCEYCYNTVDNCRDCSWINYRYDHCYSCYAPYVANNNGYCELCHDNQYYFNKYRTCAFTYPTCYEELDLETCISCVSGSYLFKNMCYWQESCNIETKYGCTDCLDDTVLTINGTCITCSDVDDNCKYCIVNSNSTTACLECDDNYHLSNGKCINSTLENCKFENCNTCYQCEDGYYLNSLNECISCNDGCNICSYLNNTNKNEECLQCNESTILTTANECIIDSNCISIENNECIKCDDSYYIKNGECTKCNDNCEICNPNGCVICSDDHLVDYDGICQTKETFNCLLIENGDCIKCDYGYDLGENSKNPYCFIFEEEFEGCLYGSINELKCIECSNEFIQFNGTCYNLTNKEMKTTSLITTDSIDDNCKYQTSKGCIKCNDGYYLQSGLCYECLNGCETCYNSTMCLSCNSTAYVNSNYECSSIDELAEVCEMLLPSRDGCAVCNDGYYKEGSDCIECDESCSTCTDSTNCLSCNDNYYQIIGESGLCTSYSQLINCLNKTSTGCIECNSQTYLNNYQCYSCNSTCLTCSSLNTCTSCIEDYVLIDNECVHYTTIEHCKEAKNSKCTSCSGLNQVNNGIECKSNLLAISLLIIIPIIIIIITIMIILVVLIKLWQKRRIEKKERENVTVFKMSRSNVIMKRLTGELCSNLKLVEYEGEIGVNEETRELICVGNTSKHQLKVQISTRDGCDKYEIRTNPQIITINKGEACEFEIFIKPLCTCKIDDQIVIIALDIHKGEKLISEIGIKAQTVMTTRLDYSELIEDQKLGEGSFGIVYKGTFRANQVAIKVMKQGTDNSEQMEEFNKEVLMLDKFRNDYIVHFYGAVFIPTKICMVTEFAQYGSLHDLMNKRKDNPIDYILKIKILLDCARGISYLHSNGILHRDIKPDNFLIFSLENNVLINAKLTDFGSSRNINMMMTNMTFTKGVGTPVYMAPEVLEQNKYKKAADVYSFAVTIYETMTWDEAYPKIKFKFPWKIAEFVTNGERLQKLDTMNEYVYSLIDSCWKHEPKERYNINQVVDDLLLMK